MREGFVCQSNNFQLLVSGVSVEYESQRLYLFEVESVVLIFGFNICGHCFWVAVIYCFHHVFITSYDLIAVT